MKSPGESDDFKKMEILLSLHKRNPEKKNGNGRKGYWGVNEGWMCVEMGV